MKLYHAATSPYVRKVMVTLALTGQTDQVELVPGGGTPLAPNEGTCSANPLGKIPCLVTEDEAMYDSRVICRYLDFKGQGGLYPAGEALFPVLTTEALADGIMDAAILGVYETRLRPEELRFSPWVQAQLSKIQRALGELESRCAIFGDEVDAGQVAVGCALGYLDFRFPDMGWREGRPRLTEWNEAFQKRPEMVATVPVE
ncbi:glutathione S-transferase [Rhodobacteraceae bacterium NNCM2]|nr:glutathione S-transferase [Coraliihabitans acroporae]